MPAGASAAEETPPPGRLGCFAVQGDRVLEELRADELFVPASVHKLAVAAVALDRLGPDFRVRTGVFGDRPDPAGVVAELVVEAAGDPTWSRRFHPGGGDEPLAELARRLAAAGVRHVRGDLVVDLSGFPGRPVPSSRAFGDLAFAFAAATSGLAVEDNAWPLRMAPGARIGEPAIFEADGLEIINRTVTAPASRHEKGTVDFQSQWQDGRLVVRGEYPISEPPYRIEVAVSDGELRAALRLRDQLGLAGIEVAGTVRLTGAAGRRGVRLAEIASPPLEDWLPAILEDSSNWHAEMLLRLLARQQTGEGRLDDGLDLLGRVLEEEVGLPAGSFAFDDASGISPFNLWTPRSVVALLDWIWRQPWRVPFLKALARPGKGTLAGWPKLPASLAAKTGTARHTDGLAGYLRVAGADPVLFACFSNQGIGPRNDRRRQLARRVGGWLP